MTYNRLKYYLIIAGCFCSFLVAAQEYVIQRLTVNDGLPSDRVNCVYEDSYGYLWVGTSNGVGRYDGKKFTNYGFSEGLSYLQVNTIFEDSFHRLWIGTTKGIVQLLGNRFAVYKTADPVEYTRTFGFYQTEDNMIWALTNKGIYRFNDSLWVPVAPYTPYERMPCKQIARLRDGLLFNYGHSLIKKRSDNTWQVIARSPLKNDFDYFNSVQEHYGKIYVSVQNRLYTLENDRMKLLLDSIPANPSYNYYVNDDDRCFVTTEGNGLYVYQLRPAKRYPLFFSSYKSNFLYSIYRDKHNNMWMSSYEGLLKIHPKTFTDYQREVFKEPVKDVRNIVSLYNDLLISSSSDGFMIWNDKTMRHVSAPFLNRHQYPRDIIDVYSDDEKDAGTWLMTRRLKLLYIKKGQLQDYTGLVRRSTRESFYDVAVHPQTRDVYICADSTLLTGDKNKMEVYHDADGKTFSKPISVVFTKDGIGIVNVFFKGIYFITKKNKIIKAPPDLDIIDERVSGWLYEGINGRMWVRNYGRGLVSFRVNNAYQVRDIQQFTTAEGLPSNDVLDIATDLEKRLWVCTSNGLAVMVYDPGKDSWDIYNVGKQLGLNFESWVDGKMAVDTYGHIWLSTTDHLIKLYPEKIHLQKEVPRAVIEKVLLGMRETDWHKYGDSVHSYFQLPYEPVLSYNQNSFGIQFNGTNLSVSSGQEYSYMLAPLDTSWSQATSNNFLSLLKLSPGSYVFKVRARGKDTGWSAPDSFSFTIQKPFWDRWWFRLMLIASAASVIVFIYSRRIRAIQQEAQIQNQLNELEMKALKAQMNPHFIYNALNSIQSLIVDEKKSEAISYVGTFSRLLRQVLEHSDNNVISLEKELHTLNLYMQLESLRLNMDLKYSLQTDEDVMTEYEKVPPLILQPFIENALWHGLSRKEGEKNLTISVSETDDYLLCVVEDNGIGREKAASFKKKSASEMYASRGIDITVRRLTEFNKTQVPPVAYKDLFDDRGQAAGTRVSILIKKQAS
jgi:hypothetical protein